MLLTIPSYKRPDASRMFTLKALHLCTEVCPYVFCREEEYQAYKKALAIFRCNIVPLKGMTGLASTRQAIIDHFGSGKIIMADDDLIFFTRTPDNKFRKSTTVDKINMVTDIQKISCENGVAIVGVTSRFMGNRTPRNICRTVRPKCFFSIDIDKAKKIGASYGKVPVQVDIEFALQCLLKGYDSVDLTEYATEQAEGFNAAGGVSDYRSAAILEDTGKKLEQMYPGIVKVFERKISGDWNGIGQTRTEVRVAWKKARKLGLARRES